MFFFDSWFKNIDFKVLGERCYLTPLQKKDLATVKKWFDDKELLKFAFGVQTDPNTIERIGKNYLKSIFKSSTEIFGIWSCKNQLLGFINYSRRNYQEDIARIGILIGKEGNRSKGIGTEAMNMALLYLFDRIGVDKVDLDTAIFNKRAHRCFHKCGFKNIRETRELDYQSQQEVKKIIMELNRKEFLEQIFQHFNKLPVFQGSLPESKFLEKVSNNETDKK